MFAAMGRKPRPGTKRLIRLRDEQWDGLRHVADSLSAGGRKKWSVTDVVSLAVDEFIGRPDRAKEPRKR